jgi:ABC-type proline/glycine betaine transport system substrate-binding protein
MAYMNQERKAVIAAALKPILAKYGVKGTLSVRSHMTICLNIKSGKIDFIENYIATDKNKSYAKYMSEDQIASIRRNNALDVNPYWFQDHFSGVAKKFLTEAFAALKGAGWYDRSDVQTDYFDTAYYVDVHIGQYDKPYQLTA